MGADDFASDRLGSDESINEGDGADDHDWQLEGLSDTVVHEMIVLVQSILAMVVVAKEISFTLLLKPLTKARQMRRRS